MDPLPMFYNPPLRTTAIVVFPDFDIVVYAWVKRVKWLTKKGYRLCVGCVVTILTLIQKL